jgi:hypothetical protein
MDVFKLAFETTIVGLLTIGWLAVAAYLLFPDFQFASIAENLPDFLRSNLTALGIGVLLLAYCLGSAALPIAKQLVNDEHWPLNENAIRCQVFTQQEMNLKLVFELAPPVLPKQKAFSPADLKPRHCSYWAPIFERNAGAPDKKIGILKRLEWFARRWIGLLPSADEHRTESPPEELETICKTAESTECDEFKARRILTIFQQEETAVLSQPSDTNEDLRQSRERIVVLRGAVFSLFVLFLICLPAYFARANGSASSWIRPALGILIGAILTVFALANGLDDLAHANIFDIPVLESLLVVITIFGVVLAFKGAKHKRFQSKRYVLITLFFTGLAYGGWMCSEILYDQQVINSFVVLQHHPLTPKQ